MPKCKVVYEFHPLSAHYPLLSGESKEEMRRSLAAIGCQNPAIEFEDKILDGRNRYIICEELGIPCPVIGYEGDEPELFVEAQNGHRRHLTDSERLLAAVALVKARDERLAKAVSQKHAPNTGNSTDSTAQNLRGRHARANQTGERLLSSESVERVAEEVGVSERTVQMAAKVLDSCAVGVQEAVKAGEVSVSDAAAVADLPKTDQVVALKTVRAGEAKTLAVAAGVKPPPKNGRAAPKPDGTQAPKAIADELGNDVPDKYRAVFEARAEFDAIGRELDAVRHKIEALAATPAGHYLEKELQSLKQQFKTLKGSFLWAKPHSLAPDKKGEPKWLSMYAHKQTAGAKV